jgi:hypothetical protein
LQPEVFSASGLRQIISSPCISFSNSARDAPIASRIRNN